VLHQSRTQGSVMSLESVQVPVMEFKGRRIGESLDISKFLEKEFPEPSVFKTSCQTGMLGAAELLQ